MATKRKERFWLPNWIVDGMLQHLSGNDLLVFLVLVRHANGQGDAWPSVGTIARKTGMSERSAQRSLRHLCGNGLIKSQTGNDGGRKGELILDDGTVLHGRPVVYRVLTAAWNEERKSTSKGCRNASARVTPVSPLPRPKGDRERSQGCQNASARVTPVSPEGSIEGSSEGTGMAVALKSIGREVPGVREARRKVEEQKAALREKILAGVL